MTKKYCAVFPPLWLLLAGIVTTALINIHITDAGAGLIYSSIKTVPPQQTILVLGGGVRRDGSMSDILRDRAAAGLDLYRAKKGRKLLLTGDHTWKKHDEVDAMKKFFLDRGVPKRDIFLDYAGIDTYDSLYRAKHIFKINSAIIVTQNFHLPRALYIAQNLNFNAVGFSADRQPYLAISYFRMREIGATVKAFFNIKLRSLPAVLGKPMPIDD